MVICAVVVPPPRRSSAEIPSGPAALFVFSLFSVNVMCSMVGMSVISATGWKSVCSVLYKPSQKRTKLSSYSALRVLYCGGRSLRCVRLKLSQALIGSLCPCWIINSASVSFWCLIEANLYWCSSSFCLVISILLSGPGVRVLTCVLVSLN